MLEELRDRGSKQRVREREFLCRSNLPHGSVGYFFELASSANSTHVHMYTRRVALGSCVSGLNERNFYIKL